MSDAKTKAEQIIKDNAVD
ncbi:hypothetical protein EPUL_005053 [Erysiphe pulchra]|uniref:Uncharacterized protein n=1 Tax=Erysiphe pulchra TaxID=225359 RepID=A0A2S4PPE0_9PEZI|nr:hypothetical protein EPUL_005053 [Erysiphe pulchra]